MAYQEYLQGRSFNLKNGINETLSKLIRAFNKENFEDFGDFLIDLNIDWKSLHNVLFELECEEI